MLTTTSTTQIFTPFGSGYVPMHHSDPARQYLARAEVDDVIGSLTAAMFGEMIRSLRSALCVK